MITQTETGTYLHKQIGSAAKISDQVEPQRAQAVEEILDRLRRARERQGKWTATGRGE